MILRLVKPDDGAYFEVREPTKYSGIEISNYSIRIISSYVNLRKISRNGETWQPSLLEVKISLIEWYVKNKEFSFYPFEPKVVSECNAKIVALDRPRMHEKRKQCIGRNIKRMLTGFLEDVEGIELIEE